MAQRDLLLRLTMCLVPLLRVAVETVPASARTRPEILDFAPHPYWTSSSLRNFFKRTIDRPEVEVAEVESLSSVEVEAAFNCSSESMRETEVLVVDSTSSSSASSSPSASPGLLINALPLPRLQSDQKDEDSGLPLPQAVVRCESLARTNLNNELKSSRDMKGQENLTSVGEVLSNRSLLAEKGDGVKVTPVDGGGGAGGTSPHCPYPNLQLPAAWSPFIKDRSLLCVVNPHWLSFPPPSYLYHVILAAVYLLIMVVGLVGNGLVIFLFISSRALRTPSNLFILNLAISDFLLVAAMVLVIHNSFQEGPAMGRVGCDVYGFLGGLAGTTSIMTLAAISFDRYLVISYPLDPFKKLSHRQVLAIILATWLYSFSFSVTPLVGFMDINYSPEGFLTTCSFDYLSEATRTRVYIFSFFVAAWVLPLNIVFFSYMSIVSTVSKQERYCHTCRGTFATSFKHQRLKRKKGVELKLTKVASGIIGLWVVAWTPYAVVALLGIFRQRHLITPFVSMVPALFCKTAACLDPFVYALSHPRFKSELSKRMMRRRSLFMAGLRNGMTQGFSASTFSEIREERELSDVQAWGTYDPSSSSLGPLLQRNTSCSSNATLERTRRRETASSPGSKSLASPMSAEIYPRKSLSTYSFRCASRTSRFDDKVEALHRCRRPEEPKELHTTALIEFPHVHLAGPSFPHSCSTSGLERITMCPNPSSHLWGASRRPPPVTTTFICEPDACPPEIDTPMEIDSTWRKTNDSNTPSATGGRTKARSNSLPNMTQDVCGRRLEGKFPKNVLLQLFQGKILNDVRQNRSITSIFQDDKKV